MNSLKKYLCGLVVLSGFNLANAQCFTSLNDYSYAYPADGQCFSAVGDVNGDGKLDIVNSTITNKITTLLGIGNGTFLNGPTSTPANVPLVHRLKDINGDGKLDLITMNVWANNVGILLGTGTGSFVPTATLSAGWPGGSAQFSDMIVTDVNNDSNSDIIVSIGNGPPLISVLLGSGTGTFSPVITYTTSSAGPVRMAIDDMNNDGNKDIVLSCGMSMAILHYGNGTGAFNTFTTVPSSTFGKGVVINDFNADGKKDFAFANWFNNTITIFLGNGAGTFSMSVISNVADTPCALDCADFSGDGKVDLAVQTDGAIVLYNGTGTGTFTKGKAFTIDMNSNLQGCVQVADFNTDGKPDLMCASTAFDRRVFAFINKGSGNLFSMPDIKFNSVSNTGGGLIVDDLNGDGRQDILIGAASDIEVSMSLGSGNYSAPITYTTGAYGQVFQSLEADFNNDSKQDILTVNGYPHSITFMAGSGTGSFVASSTMTLSFVPGNTRVGDFNNDGKKDIAMCNGSNIMIYAGSGTGTFTLANTYATTSVGILTIGDFNNDGNQDLGYASSINFYSALGNGAFGFGTAVQHTTSAGATGIANKDLNGDGRTDVVAAGGSGGNNVTVLLGTASGTFQAGIFVATGGTPRDVAIEDVNGDGFQDLVTGNYTNSDYSILLGNGTGNFAAPVNYPMGRIYSGTGILAVKDMNNDGTKDFVHKGYINANLSLGRNNVIIGYNNSAVINSTGTGTICLGNTITLHATSGAFSYLWNPGGSTADSLVVSATGVYSVTVVNPSGSCSSTASKTITVVVCTAIEEQLMNNGGISIYPNPTNNDFTIQTLQEENVIISNELGQIVGTVKLSDNNNYKTTINNLPVGIYFIKGETVKGKVIVVK